MVTAMFEYDNSAIPSPTRATNAAPHAILLRPRADLDVVLLVNAARAGDGSAWQGLIQRLQPLVRSIARGYRLEERDVEDIAQTVWLRLFEHLERIREPRALPKWVRTIARHESLRVARGRAGIVSTDGLAAEVAELPAEQIEIDVGLLRSEEAGIVRQGLAELPRAQRELLLLLSVEPPLSYRRIGRILGMPTGSIGPTRARGLARLGNTAAVRGYVGSRRPRPSRETSAETTRSPNAGAPPCSRSKSATAICTSWT